MKRKAKEKRESSKTLIAGMARLGFGRVIAPKGRKAAPFSASECSAETVTCKFCSKALTR